MDADQVLALRYLRAGLAERTDDLAAAAACPLSDFARDAALHGLAARAEGVTRERVARELVFAHTLRGAIHLQTLDAVPVFGRALVGAGDAEVKAQTGWDVAALDTVTAAVGDALRDGPLDRLELHDALRARLPAELLPWCRGCESHHAPPRVWRYALVRVGAVLDVERRHVLSDVGDADPAEAARRFAHFYPGADHKQFAEWAGLTPRHAKRLWVDLPVDGEAPPPRGVRLLPPGDPFLQKPNRALLAPDPDLRKRLFRPAASPGVVLVDGRVAGTWRVKGGEVTAEAPRSDALDGELERLRALRRT